VSKVGEQDVPGGLGLANSSPASQMSHPAVTATTQQQ